MKKTFLLYLLVLTSCQSNQETVKPIIQNITESVYASGVIKSQNQYQAFATVSGIVDEVYVDEGAAVEVGSPILALVADAQILKTDNAKLTAEFNALNVNYGKLEEAKSLVSLSKIQMDNDALMLTRQGNLWAQSVGTKVQLEQKELYYKNAKNNYESAKEKLAELSRQLAYTAKQAKNNLLINKENSNDYLVRSKIKGKVYEFNLNKGEIVTPQTLIAIIGDDRKYLLEMQVDEYDITSIQLGMQVMVVLNSFKDSVFKAIITKINPIMNLQSKTFTVEAKFIRQPYVLYPNISFEANILIRTKKNAILIPRNYLLNDSTVVNKFGEHILIKTGLKDYQMVEVLLGIDKNQELILPKE
jgi:HlyD family secretion protein